MNAPTIDVLVHGFPGRSVCHGGLGWSTVALVRAGGRVALIDAGSFGMRRLVIDRLAHLGLAPRDVTDVILTHAHHDHAVNWPLFGHARIAIGSEELSWSLTVPWGQTPVPELYMRELARWPTLRTIAPGDEILEGLTAHAAPGHTPGHLVFVLRGRENDVIFTGDAAKNRAELMSRTAHQSLDEAASRASFDTMWALWRARPGNVIVPGHDLPMVIEGEGCRAIGTREAAIEAWFGDDLEHTTRVSLTA